MKKPAGGQEIEPECTREIEPAYAQEKEPGECPEKGRQEGENVTEEEWAAVQKRKAPEGRNYWYRGAHEKSM